MFRCDFCGVTTRPREPQTTLVVEERMVRYRQLVKESRSRVVDDDGYDYETRNCNGGLLVMVRGYENEEVLKTTEGTEIVKVAHVCQKCALANYGKYRVV